jgi:hypothetical protein
MLDPSTLDRHELGIAAGGGWDHTTGEAEVVGVPNWFMWREACATGS